MNIKTVFPFPHYHFDDVLTINKCGAESVKMNASIQAKMDSKSLELSHKKCYVMHAGKNQETCPKLKVNEKEMQRTNKQRYLGNLVCPSGKVDDNIEDRFGRGLGIINQIMSLLREVSFGRYYFQMALVFRNSLLINSILCNIEADYQLKEKHVEKLESLDRILLQRVCQSTRTTAIESYY